MLDRDTIQPTLRLDHDKQTISSEYLQTFKNIQMPVKTISKAKRFARKSSAEMSKVCN